MSGSKDKLKMSEQLGMTPLQFTQIIASSLLSMGKGNVKELFEGCFSLWKWQQAPVAQMMLDFHEIVGSVVEVGLESMGVFLVGLWLSN